MRACRRRPAPSHWLPPPCSITWRRSPARTAGCPPWSDWWSPSDVAGLFGSVGPPTEVLAEQARLPLDYFRDAMPVPRGWDEGLPAAYLAFGETYAAERADAAQRGWPTRTLAGRHLHMLVDPAGVASAHSTYWSCCSRIALKPADVVLARERKSVFTRSSSARRRAIRRSQLFGPAARASRSNPPTSSSLVNERAC